MLSSDCDVVPRQVDGALQGSDDFAVRCASSSERAVSRGDLELRRDVAEALCEHARARGSVAIGKELAQRCRQHCAADVVGPVLSSKFRYPISFRVFNKFHIFSQLARAISRLCRSRCLQPNNHFSASFEIE